MWNLTYASAIILPKHFYMSFNGSVFDSLYLVLVHSWNDSINHLLKPLRIT